jgi:hypothetical protein
MDTSTYFEKAIREEQSPAAAEYFDSRVASIFVAEASQSLLEGYLSHTTQSRQSPQLVKRHDSKDRSSFVVPNHDAQLPSYQSDFEVRSEADPLAIKSTGLNDPKSGPGLPLQSLRDEIDLQEFLQKGRLDAKTLNYNCVLTLNRCLATASACCVLMPTSIPLFDLLTDFTASYDSATLSADLISHSNCLNTF